VTNKEHEIKETTETTLTSMANFLSNLMTKEVTSIWRWHWQLDFVC